MSFFPIFFEGFLFTAIVLFIFAGTFFLLFLERFVYSRVQHRDGPGRHGEVDYYQVLKDFLKIIKKDHSNDPFISKRFHLVLAFWKILPFLFGIVLLGRITPHVFGVADLLILFFICSLSVAGEAILIYATQSERERYEMQRSLNLKILGIGVLFISSVALTLRISESNLKAISHSQDMLPFHAILSSPGLFIVGITAFLSTYLIASVEPVQGDESVSLAGSWQYSFFFTKRMWIFCLLAYWVFAFCGGFEGIVAKIVFPLKLALAIFFFIFLQTTMPKMRMSDAGETTVKWLIPLCLLGLSLEILWVGFFS